MRKMLGRNAILIMMCVLLFAMTAYAGSSFTNVHITKSDRVVESSSVGISTSARYYVRNYMASTRNLVMKSYAAYTGWPYSHEETFYIAPNSSYTYTEQQDRGSNFYMVLYGYRECEGYGSITLN